MSPFDKKRFEFIFHLPSFFGKRRILSLKFDCKTKSYDLSMYIIVSSKWSMIFLIKWKYRSENRNNPIISSQQWLHLPW